MSVTRPAPIRTDGSNRFARHTMVVRVPEMLTRTAREHAPYAPREAERLLRLADEIAADAPLRMLSDPAPDLDDWEPEIARRLGERWLDTDWFFAETYLYRRVLEAVRFFETERDPFRGPKDAELADPSTWPRIESAKALLEGERDDRASALLAAALWGNRLDASYAAAAARGTDAVAADLIVDDREAAVVVLCRPGARIDLVADNAGTELLLDLVLALGLLEGGAARVVVHVKAQPTFVSDATAADVREALVRLGGRYEEAFSGGTLRIAPDRYWNSPRFIDAAPPRIRHTLAAADMVIVKGDANYRRLVGDAEWAPTTPPAGASGPLPSPCLALRTLKSDALVGLPPGLAERLTESSADWRVDGKRGIAQLFSTTP